METCPKQINPKGPAEKSAEIYFSILLFSGTAPHGLQQCILDLSGLAAFPGLSPQNERPQEGHARENQPIEVKIS